MLAANSIPRAVAVLYARQELPGSATVGAVARELFVDWDEATGVAVSGLREAAGSDPHDPRLLTVIDELSSVSA